MRQMGKELTLEEMLVILNEGIPMTSDRVTIFGLRTLSLFIKDQLLTPRINSHTFALADNSLSKQTMTENARQTFFELTGIDSKNYDLPTKK